MAPPIELNFALASGRAGEITRVSSMLNGRNFTRSADNKKFNCNVSDSNSFSEITHCILSIVGELKKDCLDEAITAALDLRSHSGKELPIALLFPGPNDTDDLVTLIKICVRAYREHRIRSYMFSGGDIRPVTSLTVCTSQTLELHVSNYTHPPKSVKAPKWTLVSWLADWVAYAFAFQSLSSGESTGSLFPSINSEAYSELSQKPSISMGETVKDGNVCRKTPDTVFKLSNIPWEMDHMNFVRMKTSIPVPATFVIEGMTNVFGMQYVRGKRLRELWSQSNKWTKFRVACTLRDYLRQLRQLARQYPGGTTHDGVVSGPLFDMESFGSFKSFGSFRYWCEMVALDGHIIAAQAGNGIQLPWKHAPGDEDWEETCFCHADLHLSNIIFGEDGRLWVIDWGSSGFYPSSFESMAMAFYDYDSPADWNMFCRWITGRDGAVLSEFWDVFSTSIQRHRWGSNTSRAW